MNHAPLRRRSRTPAIALAAFASSLALLALPSCKQEAAPPAKAADPVPSIVPESYPIRLLLVSYRKDSKDPKLPPRTDEEALARAKEARARILAPGGSFAAVAKEMSDEPISAGDDGFLGFISDWTRDPTAVLTAVRALKEGEVSEPIATAYGQQLVQRLSRAEGKALEARSVIPLEGFYAPWHDLIKTLPESFTKDASYEAVAKVVMSLRAGEYPMHTAGGRIFSGSPIEFTIRRGTMLGFEKVFATASAMKVDDISDPIDMPQGWLIVRRLPYVRCYARHILITSDGSPAFLNPSKRSRAEAGKLAEETLATLRRDPKEFDRLVKEVSEEAGSRVLGGFAGDVCNVVPQASRAIPEFEAAVWKLKAGEISPVVESRFGFHLIRRED